MRNSSSSKRGYIFVAVVSALGGCIVVTLVTKAIPRLLSQFMAEMMNKMPQLMLDHLKSEGFNPAEMCTRMRELLHEPDEPLASKRTQSALGSGDNAKHISPNPRNKMQEATIMREKAFHSKLLGALHKPQWKLDSRVERHLSGGARAKGLVLGLIAGLVATIAVDLIMMGFLRFKRQPADDGFAVIGDTAAGFFSLFGLDVPGGVPPGVAWHYLIGLAFGVIFGAAVTRFEALRLNSMKKSVGLGILYTEVMSIPMLVQVPIILKRTASETAGLFGFFSVLHAIWGILLGVVVSYGLRSAMAARQG